MWARSPAISADPPSDPSKASGDAGDHRDFIALDIATVLLMPVLLLVRPAVPEFVTIHRIVIRLFVARSQEAELIAQRDSCFPAEAAGCVVTGHVVDVVRRGEEVPWQFCRCR